MKVTGPMIQRGAEALAHGEEMLDCDYSDCLLAAEACLRAALNDPREESQPIEGQMSVDDFPEVYREPSRAGMWPGRDAQ